MEIVRQRKKRLLAWILTLVLCVGMWQGNVQAEGEDGGDGAITPTEVMTTEVPPAEVPPTEAEPTEGGDESANPVVASETGEVPVESMYVSLLDNHNEMVKSSDDMLFTIDDVPGKFSADNGKYLFAPFTKGDGIYVNGLHKHKVIEWGEAVSGECTATLGKSVVIEWGVANSQDILTDETPVAEGDSNTSVELPVVGNKNGFIKEWTIGGKTISNLVKSYQVDFSQSEEFERNIRATATLSKQIENEGGTFYLSQDVDYILSKGSWKVNGGTDGYTYGNSDGNIKFYVPSEREYSFGK